MNHRRGTSQRIATVVALCAVVLFFLGGTVSAQVTAGTIRGVVTDQSNAVIPGVQIEATNLNTGQDYQTFATEAGVYVLGNLPVGSYRLEAQSAGFKTFARQPVTVSTASTTAVDIQLEVGEVAETITVESSTVPLLQTDNSEIGTVMERKMVIDLPLDLGGLSATAASGRRQIEQFVFLTPGITGDQWSKHFLGSPRHTSQAVVDGVPHALQESPGLTSRTSPPFEAVEEFKVSTTMYPADQGRGFGIANYTIKSGTNEFHGNAFWFLRNDKLDASGFFNPIRPIVRQNEFGGTIGGPIIKNKTFFHGAFQGFRLRGGSTERGLRTIPTLDFRQGDFGALREPDGTQIPIFDPASTRGDGAGGFVRDPFPNNVIPASQISRVSRDLTNQMPNPDLPGIVDNWVSLSARPSDDDVWSVKIDHNEGPHRVAFSYWWVNFDQLRLEDWGDDILDTGFSTGFTGGGYRVNWDWVVNPTLLNHFGFGFSTSDKDRLPAREIAPNPLNIPGISTEAAQFPRIFYDPYLGIGSSQAGPDITRDDAIIFTDTVSWTRGRHQLKFGGEYWDQRFTRFDGRVEGGAFTFRNLSTSQPNSPNFGRFGDPFASVMVGDVFDAERTVNPFNQVFDTRYFAVFLEDKIQVTPKLTVSIGLRYEVPWPIDEANENVSAIDLSLPNAAAGGLLGAYAFGNDALKPALDKNEWSPRLGLAYKLSDKTVIRSGFGLIYAQSNALVSGMELGGNDLRAGFSGFQSPTTLDEGVTPALNWDAGFPPFEGQLPNRDPGLSVGNVADFLSLRGGKAAYTVNYNLTIQRELPFNIVTDIAYVGNKGSRLPSNLEILNQVPSQFLSLGSLLQAPITSPDAQAAGISAPFPGFQGTVAQALRPFPQYTTIQVHANPIGNHTYHSLQAKAQKRFSGGLGFLVHYTLSKNISDTAATAWSNTENTALDTARRDLEKAIAPIDRTHVLISTLVYELPFGKSSAGAKQKLINGWQLAVTSLYQSGPPLSIRGGASLPIFNGGNRPTRVAGADRFTGVSKGDLDPARDLLLNIDAFAQPAPFTFGDVARIEPDLRGFSSWNENITLSKRTYIPSISEQFNVEFRAEFFNVFNRTVFGNPGTSINSPQSFGRVSSQANNPRTIQFALKVNF